jgi:pilus assembly protein FimV
LLIDPHNPLYLQGGAPAAAAPASDPDTLASVPPDIDLNFDDDGHQAAVAPPAQPADAELNALLETQSDNGVELDFDLGETPAPAPADDLGLEFDLDQAEVAEAAPPMAEPPQPTPPAADDLSMDFDLDLSEIEEAPAAPPVAAAPTELPQDVRDLSLDLDLDMDAGTPAAEAAPAEPDPLADFNDLANLQVDEGDAGNDPLETKLSLAREFEAIGDTDGARSLAEEVEAEASGDLQARARAFLSQLS